MLAHCQEPAASLNSNHAASHSAEYMREIELYTLANLITAIWLKTGGPAITFAAVAPMFAVALLKYSEGEDDLFIKNSNLIAIHNDTGQQDAFIPEYEHELLRKDWMPPIMIDKGDRREFNSAKKRFKWMRVVAPDVTSEGEKAKGAEGKTWTRTRQER